MDEAGLLVKPDLGEGGTSGANRWIDERLRRGERSVSLSDG